MNSELPLSSLLARARRSSAEIRTALADGLAQPTHLVLLIALFQIAIWGALSGILAVAPPDDSLEQVLLSQELRLEYGKHPPLPTWILFATSKIFGPSLGATFVLGASCSVATMLLLYAFARPLIGARSAALAAILLSNVEYMNAGTAYFNHNTVQLPLALLAIVLFHRALTRMRWTDWAMLGAGCGVMMLAKFSALVLFASFAAYLLYTRRLGEVSIWKGLAVAAVVALAILLPYLVAALSDPWSPNAYAMQSIFPDDGDRIRGLKSVWGFASSQVSKVMPAVLIFIILRRGEPRTVAVTEQTIALGPFLTLVGFGPFVLTIVVAAMSGAQLLVGWGTTFHVLLTFWLVATYPLADEAQSPVLRRTAFASVALQIVLWALVTTHGGRVPNLNPTPHPVVPPTPPQLADAVRDTWARHCAAPLRYVLTDGHTGAELAVRYRGQPRVVDALRPEFTKFFPDDVRIAEGAVVVVRRPENIPASRKPGTPMDELIADAAWRTNVSLPASNGQRHEYVIGILLPLTGQGCEYAELNF